MFPGCEGAVLPPTVNVLTGLFPHEFTATTESVPPVPLVVTVMLFVEEVPVQPAGFVQV